MLAQEKTAVLARDRFISKISFGNTPRMIFNVPQFIDVEDKVAGPLTAKQILWMVGMGGVLFLAWTFFDTATFFVLSVPIIIIFVLFAFYRPYNQSLLALSANAVSFLFRPKVYTWDRPAMVKNDISKPKEEERMSEGSKSLSMEEIQSLAKVVDENRNQGR